MSLDAASAMAKAAELLNAAKGPDGKSFDMAAADISNLAQLLDPNLGHEKARPAGQGTGYSMAENTNVYGHHTGGGDDGSDRKEGTTTDRFSSPGGIALPSTAVDVQIGLPVPSMTKAGKELAHEKATKRIYKPKGDDIWADEEVLEVIVAPSAAITANTRIAPLPTKETLMPKHHHTAGAAEAQGRAEPEYEVLLRQKVGTEDIYLGVDFERDGSSATAEHVVVKVKLPLCGGAKEINIDVKPFSMKLETPNDYYVSIPLPVQCVEGKAAAKWDVLGHVLTATLDVDPSLSKVKVM